VAKNIVFALVLAASLTATPALAQERSGHAQMISVRYADLDPSRTEDAATLLARLRRAAQVTCTPETGRGNARLNRSIDACRTEALDRAVASIDRPELSRLYAAERR
jgi:UrcA family protein